jgi:hypothetical protein
MQLVNWQGALIGPGSEWFWSMAQFVVVTITLIGIYFQFRLQRAATTFEQLNRLQEQWAAEPLTRAKLQAVRAIHAGDLVPDAPTGLIGNFCEGVASLVRHGHANARVVYETMGPSIITYWVLHEDTVQHLRERDTDPTLFAHFEWLAHTFLALAAQDGVEAGAYDRAALIRTLPEGIEALKERIRIAEDSRAVPSPAARGRQKSVSR